MQNYSVEGTSVMKKLILALMLFATPAMAASDIVMYRDPGCGCCEKWAAQVRAAF
jgi:hypothetical protein